MYKKDSHLIEVLNEELLLDIVDVGASKLEGDADPVYEKLLNSGLAHLIGFEPNINALDELNKTKSSNETYLPYALGDGKKHTLNICAAWGMTSILEPNYELLNYFHGFTEWAKITSKTVVETKRLDDIQQIKNIDFIKLDVQGAELLILENAPKFLEKCLAIHTEVEFLEMYKNQPLFSEIELFLKKERIHFA
ncbi:MAG: FkbM family methyltransferase [Cytophagales bacterium]|nr:FkbM family methyltransferase [Cytophagales bacterium]